MDSGFKGSSRKGYRAATDIEGTGERWEPDFARESGPRALEV